MKTKPLKSLDIIPNPFGTVNALHCIDNVNTMYKEAKMETTRKLIKIEGLAVLALEALRAIRRLEIAWARKV